MTSTQTAEPANLGQVLGSVSARPRPETPVSESAGYANWQRIVGLAGERYRDCRISGFIVSDGEDFAAQRNVLQRIREFSEGISDHVRNGCGLLLYGPPGTGKDHLMFACMKLACKAGASVEWRNGLDWFGQLRDNIDRGVEEAQVVRDLVGCDVLAISDPLPPHGDLSSYQGQMLLRVIDRRYRKLKSTWVTMNVADRAEAEDRMGAALVDRLRDNALALHCNWPSFRRSM